MFWDDGKLKYGGYWYEMSYAIEDGWPATALAYAGQTDTAAKALGALCGPVTLDKTSATVNGSDAKHENEWIYLPGGLGEVRIVAMY